MFRSRKSSESNITIDKEKDKDLESKKNRSSSSQSNIKRSSHKSQESIPVSKASSGENLIFGDAIFKTKKPVQEYFRQNIGTHFYCHLGVVKLRTSSTFIVTL